MKFNILLAAGAALMLSACSNRELPFDPDSYDGPTGKLSTANLLLSVTIDDDVRTRAVDTDDFIVEIKKGDVLKYSYTYSELPEVITLPEGSDYTVEVKSDDKAKEAEWEAPFYVGSQSFEIEAAKVTRVEKVVCSRDNVRVTVRFDEDLKAVMGEDTGVTVDAGVGSSVNLFYGKDEKRDGYFAHSKEWTTLAAHFKGFIDGEETDYTKTYENVKPGDHFIITYSYSSPINPGGEGGIDAEHIYIESRVERVDKDGKIEVVEEVIHDADRPSDGSDENPDDSQPDDPVAEGPKVAAVDPINLDEINVVDGSSHVELLITSQTGITAFTVDIVSDVLTPEELANVGLDSHLDLVDPATSDLAESLSGLGFPVKDKVESQTDLSFDISGFMGLLGAICESGDQHEFVLTVTDATGTVEKTLKLKMK